MKIVMRHTPIVVHRTSDERFDTPIKIALLECVMDISSRS